MGLGERHERKIRLTAGPAGSPAMPLESSAPAGGCTLARLLHSLADVPVPPLTALIAPTGLDAPVTGTVRYDTVEPLPDGDGALLLACGLSENDSRWPKLLQRSVFQGFSALVVKEWTGDTSILVTAAAEHGTVVLTVPPQSTWRGLEALVAVALGASELTVGPVQGAVPELLELVNAIALQTGGSVAIEGLDRRILEFSAVPGQRIDDVRRRGILDHRVPDVPSNSDQYRMIMAAAGLVHFDAICWDPADPDTLRANGTADEMARSAVAIRSGAEPLGTLWTIEDPAGMTAAGTQAMLDGARLAAFHLLLARQARELVADQRCRALLLALAGTVTSGSGSVSDRTLFPPAGLDLALIGFGLAEKTAGSTKTIPQLRQLAARLGRHFAAFCPDAAVAQLDRTVVVLLPTRGRDSAERMTRAGLAAAGPEWSTRLRAAVSFPAAGHSDQPTQLPNMLAEVNDILGVLTSGSNHPEMATLAQVHAQVILAEVAQVLRARPRLRHAGIESMVAHDQKNNTDYGPSVTAWLDAVGDISAAAARLGVHTNTLRYRLRRVGELFDLRLDTPDDRLSAWLQLRLDR